MSRRCCFGIFETGFLLRSVYEVDMAYWFRFVVLALILIVTLGSVGLVQGLWIGRWVQVDQRQEIEEMETLPHTIGSWDARSGTEKATKPPMDEWSNYLRRRYVKRDDGDLLTVLLTRGKPGPMVIKHLPTECYISNGYELEAEPKRHLVSGSDMNVVDEFWVATFKKTNEATPQRVRVYWSWSADGRWQTPERPRVAFAGHRVLYKLYVVRLLASDDQGPDGSQVQDFIKDLTQAMRKSLFAATTH